MNKEIENKVRDYLKEQGFKPRYGKDINNYIRQLNTRLGKQGKKLYVEHNNNDIKVYIGEKRPVARKTKFIAIKVTEDEEKKYKELAKNKKINLSKLVRNLLDNEIRNQN